MKNAFARFGRTCVSTLVGGALAACSLLAASNVVTVNLPQNVTIGSTTLPSGQYSISSLNSNGGDDMFVIRSEKGAVVVQAQRTDAPFGVEETRVVLAKDGDSWSIDKLIVDGRAYQFLK